MSEVNYVVWEEDKYYVAQCLNVDVSSFGETLDEAIGNIKEALELYFEGENIEVPKINRVFLGKDYINA